MLNSIFFNIRSSFETIRIPFEVRIWVWYLTSLHGFHKVQLYLRNWDAVNCCLGLPWTERQFTYCTL